MQARIAVNMGHLTVSPLPPLPVAPASPQLVWPLGHVTQLALEMAKIKAPSNSAANACLYTRGR